MELWSHGNTRKRSWSRVYLFPCLVRFSFEEYFTRRKVERFFGKSDLESNEERSGKVFFQKRGKKRVKELEYGISLPCLFIHLTTLRLQPKRDDYVGGTKGDICRVVVKNE